MSAIARMHCPTCGKETKCVRSGPNHVLHLLVTIALLIVGSWQIHPMVGLLGSIVWVFVWVISAARSKFHCDICGAVVTSMPGGDVF